MAVLIDALGTLVELQPPAPRLRAALAEEGFVVTDEQAAAGFGAEISYYLQHHLDGHDRDSLDDLRDRCAERMREALGVAGLDHATARRAMLGSLEFRPFDDAVPALSELRAGGERVVVVSNWDCSLPEWLRDAGLLPLVDGVVSSAEVGVAKPDPAPFLRGLELAGAAPGEALHAGDSVDNDVAGARAAGVRAVLVARDGAVPDGVEAVGSLAELPRLVFGS
jgi:putative hydrolase of the HAD superfamily